jgi:periplasmic copper chaperone A
MRQQHLTSRLPAAATATFLLLSAAAQAAGPTIGNAWFRALPAQLPAGGYFDLHNGGAKTISLVGADSPACGMLMLHKSERSGGMEHMTEVARVDVPPGGTVSFAPGGYHLMCMDPMPMLKIGARVPVTLQFADGTSLRAEFAVRNAAGY